MPFLDKDGCARLWQNTVNKIRSEVDTAFEDVPKVYVQNDEPLGVGDGALWLDMDENLEDKEPKTFETINVTYSATEQKFSADKTFKEISSLLNSGIDCIVKYSNTIYKTFLVTASVIQFANLNIESTYSTKDIFTFISSGVINKATARFDQSAIATVNTNSALKTTNKTLVGAINEINDRMGATNATIILKASEWVDNNGTLTYVDTTQGVSFTNGTLFVNPNPAGEEYNEYIRCGVRCIEAGNGAISFAANIAPTINLTVNVTSIA